MAFKMHSFGDTEMLLVPQTRQAGFGLSFRVQRVSWTSVLSRVDVAQCFRFLLEEPQSPPTKNHFSSASSSTRFPLKNKTIYFVRTHPENFLSMQISTNVSFKLGAHIVYFYNKEFPSR